MWAGGCVKLIGRPNTQSGEFVPTSNSFLAVSKETFVHIAGGAGHMALVGADQKLYVIGDGSCGQCGPLQNSDIVPDLTAHTVPLAIDGELLATTSYDGLSAAKKADYVAASR